MVILEAEVCGEVELYCVILTGVSSILSTLTDIKELYTILQTSLSERSLHFTGLRQGSNLSSLICKHMQRCALRCYQLSCGTGTVQLTSSNWERGKVHGASLATVSRLSQETSREIVNTQIFMNVHGHTHRARSVPGVFTLHYTRGHLCPSSTIWMTANRPLDLVIASRLATLQEEG